MFLWRRWPTAAVERRDVLSAVVRLLLGASLLTTISVQGYSPRAPPNSGGGGGGGGGSEPCYGDRGRAQRCHPPFVNAAFNLPVDATNTCGTDMNGGSEEFCQQTGISGATKSCDVCDDRVSDKRHPPKHLTDYHAVDYPTWWQSGTMLRPDVQWPSSVNLTLNLGKSFEITYVRLKFHSSRPESFAIHKRTTEKSQWDAYQFYSASCQSTYGLQVSSIITRQNEAQALCRDDFSDISPLTGGSVAFSTLEGRPSAYDFENSPVLQDWVTATDIRIVLNRINTFRDEVFGDPNVLRSYFYAISDFAVGGRCKCNGHASECIRSTGQYLEDRLVCRCEHNTTGPDCGECLPFYNDRPWKRATGSDAYECQPCDCNGLSTRCYFDDDLFRRTGRGGHCTDCRENRAGPNCERCKDNFYLSRNNNKCQACNCNPLGSRQQQCDSNGGCECKPGVTGEKCDKCLPNHFDFGPTGCRQCECLLAGSANNRPDCIQQTGSCRCKENVMGQNCDTCKQGYFGLSESDPLGCMSCFCYGHSSTCTSATGYSTRVVHSDFDSGLQKWRGEMRGGQDVALQYNAHAGNIGASSSSNEPIYFVAPDRYLGDQRHSYNLLLTFTLRTGDDSSKATAQDIILEGDGITIKSAIFGQSNQLPRTSPYEYKFRLNEHPSYQWTRMDGSRLSAIEFMRLLSNVTAIKIRATYSPQGVGFIDNVKLQSAREGGGGTPATNVEQCTCPEGFVGQFCESCAPGYRREPLTGGALARCVPCNCNKHSDACDAITGRCICNHNTVGASCERCAPGYFGYALAGTPNDCKPCPCPDGGQCVQLMNGDVACIGCREGYTGHRCNLCLDGYFGDPDARIPCQKCMCNDNIDSNAVGNCDRKTGECLKCIYNTAGFHCDKCLPHHYGHALAQPRGQCKPCNCYKQGTAPVRQDEDCDLRTGQCHCRPQVTGLKCDQCTDGYWNIDSGSGCERCNCDYTGSLNNSCDIHTGQCYCKPGVGSTRCDSCADGYYSFSREGCVACNCNSDGSLRLQCDQQTGVCPCKPNIGGKHCDRCAENKHDIAAGCIDCPVCYNLVQEQVNLLRQKIIDLRTIIKNINENPGAIDDADFRRKLGIVNSTVVRLLRDARSHTGSSDGSMADQLNAISIAITDINISINTITENIAESSRSSHSAGVDTSAAERAVDQADKKLRALELLIEIEGKKALQEAKDAQAKLGQQSTRMTEIATEARNLSLRQETDSLTIEITSKEALNTSQEALRIVQSALQKPGQVSDDIVKIRREVNDASRLYNETKTLAEASQKQAQKAYNESLKVYIEVENIRIVKTDMSSTKVQFDSIKDDASKIKQEANDLIDENRDLVRQIQEQKVDAERLIDDGIVEQQKADELLADADAARDMARKALAKAEQLLREANQTLHTLLEFDKKVKDSKDDAEEALKRIPEIQRYIQQAEQKTQEAKDNLADAEKDAIQAKELAESAQILAEKAILEATLIHNETTITKHRSEVLRTESETLLAQINDIEARLKALEDQAEEDARLAREALEKADQAKTSAVSSSKKVTGALTTVNDILRQLSTLDKIDIDKLNQLETQLVDADRQLVAAGIDTRYKELETLYIEMNTWLYDYTNQLTVLTDDVENIKQINATIPRTCFKKVSLEPTDPTG